MSMTRARSTKASARIAAKSNEDEKDLAEDEDEEVLDDENQGNEEEDDTGAEGDDESGAEDDDTAEDDDESAEDDEEEAPKSKGKAKASGEKARIAGILRHAEASGRGELAEYLAFETNMSIGAAAKILKAAPKSGAAKGSLKAAMQGKNPNIRPGAGAATDEDKAVAALGWAVKHLNGA